MTGIELKEIIRKHGVSYAAVAFKIGGNSQTMQSTFNSPDVKSGIIEAVAGALGVSVAELYSKDRTHTPARIEPEPEHTETPEEPTASNDMQQVLLHLTALVTTQNKKIDELSKQLADLTALVSNQRNTTQFVFADSSPRQVADTTENK